MMLHATPLRATQRASLFSRRRAQLAGALIAAALMPYLLRSLLWEGTGNEATSLNALGGNVVAIILAMWVRMSVETYPGCGQARSTCRWRRCATWR